MKIFKFSFGFIYGFIAIILFFILSITYLSKLSGETISLFGDDLVYKCEYKKFIGKECGSCGLSRSWVSLSNFEFKKSRDYNNSGPKTFFASHLYLFGCFILLYLKKINLFQMDLVLMLIQFLSILMLVFSWIDIIRENVKLETYNLY